MPKNYTGNTRQYPVPENEADRIAALRRYQILDTSPEEAFDRITRMAATCLEVPVSLVSLVDESRQWFKSHHGIDAEEIPREIAFCAHTIMGDQPMVIEDATADPRFANNPLVTTDPNIRFYAGAPLITHDGFKLGSLCVFDQQPRTLSGEQHNVLKDLAALVVDAMELRLAGKRASDEIVNKEQEAQALYRSTIFIQSVLDNAVDGIITIDQHGMIESYNRAAEHLFGYTVAELAGKGLKLLMPEPYYSEYTGYMQNCACTDDTSVSGITREITGLRKDGSSFQMEVAISTLRMDNRIVFTGFVRDITQRHAVEAKLNEFKNTLDQTLDCVFMFDAESLRFFYFNQGAQQQVGYSDDELMQMTPVDIKPELDSAQFQALIAPLLDGTQSSLRFETTHRHKDGHDTPVDVFLQLITNENSSSHFISIVRDITDRKQNEQQLHDREAHISAIVDNAVDGIITINELGIVETCNHAAIKMFGYSASEVVGNNIKMLMPQPYAESHDGYLASYRNGGGARVIGIGREVTGQRKDGSVFPMELSVAEVKLADRRIFTGIVRDITERHTLQKSLADQRKLLDTLWQGMRQFMEDENLVAIAEHYLQKVLELTQSSYGFIGEILYDNEGAPYLKTRAITNIAWDDATRRFYDENAPQGMEFRNLRSLFGAAISSGKVVISNLPSDDPRRGGLPEGHPALDAFLGVPVYYGGEMVGMYGIANRPEGYDDELVEFLQPFTTSFGSIIYAKRSAEHGREMQAELFKAKEIAEKANRAKSDFLSRMSHELRTPLNAILGFGQILEMEECSSPDEQESVAHIIKKAGRHLTDLINEVLDIARIESGRQNLSPEPVQVRRVLEDAWGMIRPLANERNIQLNYAVPDEDGVHVLADLQRLKQVLLNLMSNAVKYNHDGGSITLFFAEKRAGIIRISISDTGPGITEEGCHRIFEPFERLGAEGSGVQGSGIGLALSKALVEAMGGMLGLDSEPGIGSTFWVELPLIDGLTGQESGEQANHGATRQPEAGQLAPATLLYIEDNIANMRLIEVALSRRPHIELLAAMEGELGLDLALQRRPDIILLDLHLPDLMGDEVLARLKSRPETQEIPVVIISADATRRQIEKLLAAGAYAYLTKPYNIKELLRTIDTVLESRMNEHAHD